VEDRIGRRYSFNGTGLTTFPWQAWPGVIGFNALMEWQDQDGKVGKGETQDFLGLSTVTALGAEGS